MTALYNRKTKLTFETGDVVRERGKLRAVIVETTGGTVAFVRLKGTRQRYPFEWSQVLHMAAKIAAAQVRAEKLAARRNIRVNLRST